MIDKIEKSSEIIDNFASQTERLIDRIYQPQIEAREYFVDAVKNNSTITDEEAIALISNSRKIVREYANCKSILEKAKEHFFDKSEKNIDDVSVDCDWLNSFFDKARLISNEDMQIIWSRLLSKKMDNPNQVNLSLLHTISIMSTDQANFFCNMCRFCFHGYKNDIIHPLIFLSTNVVAYGDSGITNKKLRELSRLGLIDYMPKEEFVIPKKFVFTTGNKVVAVYGDPDKKDQIKAGNVIFTDDGLDLYSIVEETVKKYRSDILDFTIEKFKNRNCTVTINDGLVRY